MNKEETESPYCEVCGTCGYIDCCGISNFINKHIKGKTNCKNEEGIISELEDLCKYETDVFNENKGLEARLQSYKAKEDKLRRALLDKLTDIPFYRDDKIKDEYSHRLYKYMNELLRILNEGEQYEIRSRYDSKN